MPLSTFKSCCASLLGLLIVAAPVHAASAPYRSESFDAAGLRSVYAQTSGGSIEVSGSDSDQASVDMYVTTSRGGTDAKEIEKRLSAYRISIVREGDALRAVSETGWDNWKSQLTVSFKIRVPHKIDCTLKTSGGDLAVSELVGTQQLDTSGGSVHLEKLKGTGTASTSGGDISIAGYDGKLKAGTSGGSIKARDSVGDFDLETSGGSIELAQLAGAIDASTSGGSIRADLSQLSGALKLSTSGGNVRASIPLSQGLDLDLRGSKVNVDLINFSGTAKEDVVRGKINGGGVPVQLATSGGSVYLSFKSP